MLEYKIASVYSIYLFCLLSVEMAVYK